MFLHTPLYFAFLLGAGLLYWVLPVGRVRQAWLLGVSYIFYASFDARLALLLGGLTLASYYLGQAIHTTPRARLWAWVSIGLNVGVLLFFKHVNFFLAQIPLTAGWQILLPIGLSFYAFQAIAYTTEIYRKKLTPAPLLELALYLAFFPKLIAGPLARPAQFFSQLQALPAQPPLAKFGPALELIVLGLFKKLVIADSLAVLADTAFRAADYPLGAGAFPTPLFIQGFYLYAFQIFTDFSGYTDLARGSALLLGFELPENFQQPYLAVTLGEFWNRWHMSLTQWFREYLFFPLSRLLLQRLGRERMQLAQMVANFCTMLLIGWWHGAAWTFVAWGLWHGLWITAERLLNFRPTQAWLRGVGWVVTFHLVALGWVLFRANSLASALHFAWGLVAFEQMYWLPYYLPSVAVTALLVLGIELATAQQWLARPLLAQHLKPVVLVAAGVCVLVLAILSLARGTNALPFIYGQF